MRVRPIYPSESAITDEVVELAVRWLVDINERTNAGYHGRCGQLCYYCTTAKCLQATSISKLVKNNEPQAALQVHGSFIVSIHSSDNSGMVKLKLCLTSSTKLKQLDFPF